VSSTRRAPKRQRDRRRAENDALRTARRDTIGILLSRAQRGVLSADEAALLRTHVEAEIAEGNAARASERGQQRAMEKQRQRVEAAEQAITELEAAVEQAEQRADCYRAAWRSARRRAAQQAEPAPVITDRKTIRNALDEPRPAHP
jgi:hypothetical protein